MKRIAMALVQGADGAGKSTLINAQLARWGAGRVARVSARCPADLSVELGRLVASSRIDHVIVELGNGVDADSLTDRRRLQVATGGRRSIVLDYACIASVVDSTCFLRDLVSEVHVVGEGSVRIESRAMMLAEQIEASEVIVVTKTDLTARTDLSMLLAVLGELNPTARVVIAQHGRVPSLDLFDRSHVELARALREMSRRDVLDPAAGERASAGISSYVYRARLPFNPERLYAQVHRPWPGVLRSRGMFWLATRMDEAGMWSQAGSRWQTSSGGFWWAALYQRGWPLPPGMAAAIREQWREPFGDRRQELALIGLDMDTRALKAAFDACLLSPDELATGDQGWLQLTDPFPPWIGSGSDAARDPSFELPHARAMVESESQ